MGCGTSVHAKVPGRSSMVAALTSISGLATVKQYLITQVFQSLANLGTGKSCRIVHT